MCQIYIYSRHKWLVWPQRGSLQLDNSERLVSVPQFLHHPFQNWCRHKSEEIKFVTLLLVLNPYCTFHTSVWSSRGAFNCCILHLNSICSLILHTWPLTSVDTLLLQCYLEPLWMAVNFTQDRKLYFFAWYQKVLCAFNWELARSILDVFKDKKRHT